MKPTPILLSIPRLHPAARESRRILTASVALLAVTLFAPAAAHAATYTWDANGTTAGVTDGTGIWNTTAGNTVWWNGLTNSVWSNSGPNDAVFGNSNGAAGTVNIGASITIGNLTFNPAGSGNYTLQGAANVAANTITFSGVTPTITTNASATIAALVNSSSGFIKEGLGTLTLKGSTAGVTQNVIGGTITVNAGTLVIGPQNNNSSGEGAFQGNLTLANFARFRSAQGDIISNSGRITVGVDAFADFGISGESNVGGLAGSGRVYIPGGSSIGPRSGTHDFTGVLSGAGGLFLNGGNPVNQILSGANLHTGDTLIQSGTGNSLTLNHINAVQYSTLAGILSATKLIFGLPGPNTYNLGALGGSGSVSLGQNTISVGASNLGALSDAVISGSGGVIKLGTGIQALSGANLYTGATRIGGGTFRLQGAGALAAASAINFEGTSTFDNNGGNRTLGTVNRLAGNATFSTTYNNLTTSLTLTSLTARSAGSTTNFVVSGGTNGTSNKIVVSSATTDAFIDHGASFNGDNFAWNDAAGYVRAMRYSGPADAGAVTSAGGASLSFSTHQQITGAVTAQTNATFTTLKIAGANAFSLAATQAVTVDSILKTGANANLSGGAGIQASLGRDLVIRTPVALSDALTINTPILANGSNALTKAGLGSLTLGALAVNTYTGGTFVNEGTLIVNQDSNFGSTVAPNNIALNGGTLQPSANFALHANHGIDVGPAGGTINGNGFGLTLGSANMLSGSGPLTITGGSNINTVLTSSATQDYTGRMTVGANSLFAGRIALGADNLTDSFGTGDITVITGGAGSAVYVNRPGSVWSNRFTISGNGAESRGVIRTQQGGTFNGDIILAADASISSDGTGTTTTLNGNISGPFVLTLGGRTGANATNKYVLTGNNVHNSSIIGLGIANIDHDIALGAYNGTVTLHGNATLQAGADGIILNPDRSIALTGGVSGSHYIDVQAHDMTIQGVITGTASETLVIRGTGNLRLTGANTYSGSTLIEGGTANASILGNAGVPGSLGQGPGGGVAPTVILSQATLDYDADHPAATAVHIVVGGASGNRATIASNATAEANTVTFTNPAEIGYAGVGPRELIFAGTNRGTFVSPIGNGSPTEPTTLIVENGEWTVLGVNTHSGGTRLTGGTLVVVEDRNFGSTAVENHIALDGGTLRPAANIELHARHGIDVDAPGGTIAGNGFSLTLPSANMLSGSGPLTIRSASGTTRALISSATQDYTGPMTVGVVGENTRIGLGADNVTNPFGTGRVVVREGSSVVLNRPGSVWNNPFEIAGNGADGRGVIPSERGGTFNGDMQLNGNASIRSDGADTRTVLNGNISGPYALTVGGGPGAGATNVYELRGTNTHAATIVGRGITAIEHDRALGATNGNVTIEPDATLRAGAPAVTLHPDRTVELRDSGHHYVDTQTYAMTIPSNIVGPATGTLVKEGEGSLTLSGNNQGYFGRLEVRRGTVVMDSPTPNTSLPGDGNTGTRDDIVVSGHGHLVFANSEQVGRDGSLEVREDGSVRFSRNGLIQTLDALLVSSGSVVTDANALELVGNNTVTLSGGTTTISTGGLISDKHWVITGGTNTVEPDGLLRVQSGTGTIGLYFGGTASPTITVDSDAVSPGEILLRQDVTVDATLTSGTAQILSGGAAAFAGRIDMNGDTRTWSVNNGSAAVDLLVSASIQNGALTKAGTGTLKLIGANTFSGATTINAGTLEAGASGALGLTASIAVNTGGTLLLSSSGDRINDGAAITLAGGTLNTGELSETVGTLTLSLSSIIDMGTGSSLLHFADSSALTWMGTLSIWNWSGNPAIGGGTDQLFFGNGSGTGLTTSQLTQIKFYSDAGSTILPYAPGFSAFTGGFGEVVPVPEPSGVAVAMGLLGLIGWRERRKFQARRRESRDTWRDLTRESDACNCNAPTG